MGLNELLTELRKLNRADKLRAMQILVTELASEEDALLMPGTEYEVWSPYDSADASQVLLDLLKQDSASNHD